MTRGPIRSCAACRKRQPQAELVRVALPRSPGRGAYVCPEPACMERAVATGALARALRMKGPLPESLMDGLRSQIAKDEGRDG